MVDIRGRYIICLSSEHIMQNNLNSMITNNINNKELNAFHRQQQKNLKRYIRLNQSQTKHSQADTICYFYDLDGIFI